jgi:Ras-related C3 botulinum toxin substrate 1
MNTGEPLSIKLVVVGDGSVGKTCILLRYLTLLKAIATLPISSQRITCLLYSRTTTHTSKSMAEWSTLAYGTILNFYRSRDTAGQETYSNLRTLSYGQADIFLIVFSVIDSNSFQNAINKVHHYDNHLSVVPRIITG